MRKLSETLDGSSIIYDESAQTSRLNNRSISPRKKQNSTRTLSDEQPKVLASPSSLPLSRRVAKETSPFQSKRRRPGLNGSDRSSSESENTENQTEPPGPRSLTGQLRRLSRSQRKSLLKKSPIECAPSDELGVDNISMTKERALVQSVLDGNPEPTDEETETITDDERPIMVNGRPLVVYPAQKKILSQPSNDCNQILLHVYDLISREALMLIPPFSCVFEIGQCFADLNSALHELGTGAYHVGLEVNGVEYAYGAATTPGRTGVFTCFPKTSPGYQYRTTINLGVRPLVKRLVQLEDGIEERPVAATVILKEMSFEYMGTDYDILRKNCCSFACDACQRLGVPEEEIPSWFRNLAESGAATQDAASAAVQPIASIASVLSTYEDVNNSKTCEEEEEMDERNHKNEPTSNYALGGMCE